MWFNWHTCKTALCCRQSMIRACLRRPRYDVQSTWRLRFCSVICIFTQFHSPSCRVSFACILQICCSVFSCFVLYKYIWNCTAFSHQSENVIFLLLNYLQLDLYKTFALILESQCEVSNVPLLKSLVVDKERMRLGSMLCVSFSAVTLLF